MEASSFKSTGEEEYMKVTISPVFDEFGGVSHMGTTSCFILCGPETPGGKVIVH